MLKHVFSLIPNAALLAACLVIGVPSSFAQARKGEFSTPEEAFMGAREAARLGQRDRIAAALEKMRGHPLEMYGEQWLMMARKSELTETDYQSFFSRFDKSVVAERTRVEFLRMLGRKGAWDLFDTERPKVGWTEDLEVLCYSAQARLRRNEEAALKEAQALWLTPRELPEGCVTMAEGLITSGRINDRQVWERIRALVDSNQPNAAKRAAEYLPESHAFDAKRFDSAFNQPERFLKAGVEGRSRAQRELAVIALGRWSRDDPRGAAEWWKLHDKKPFNETERQLGWAQIGFQAARKLMPEADDWFAEATEVQLPDEHLQWMARAALRARDWKLVLRAIRDMSAELRRDPAWTYWLGRSLKEQGKTDDARVLFESIAADFSFYGQMAAEELGRVTTIPPVGHKPSKEEIDAIAQQPGLVRALMLYRLGLRSEANREWIYSIRGMDDKQLITAAHLARANNLPDRAINTADKTVALHDFSLRFLSPHADEVRKQSKDVGLDVAWVYGLMRQESRFIPSAKSVVGASGLMQLMPATARWVAKKINLTDFHPSKVNELDVNIALGTNYLKIVLDELFDHQALASAAYNAGPGRPRRWRDVKPMETAIFAESIPLPETRDYVKKVLSNAVYYQALFTGKPATLKERMPMIPARKAEDKPTDTP